MTVPFWKSPLPLTNPRLLISYFALVVPVGFAILSVAIPKPVDFTHVAQDIQTIQEATSQAVADGEEVLFINQRHLLADKSITVFLLCQSMNWSP